MAERTYGHTLAITGVPVNAEGTLVWRSLDDVVRHPEAHGLLTAIETAVHLHRWTMMLNMDAFKRFPRLNIEFHATLDDVFTRLPIGTTRRCGFTWATGCWNTTSKKSTTTVNLKRFIVGLRVFRKGRTTKPTSR